MKKTTQRRPLKRESGEMLPEYRFDYRKSRPNRFAGRVDVDRVVVVLDPDVSEAFPTQQDVNAALRTLIAAMPRRLKPKPTAR